MLATCAASRSSPCQRLVAGLRVLISIAALPPGHSSASTKLHDQRTFWLLATWFVLGLPPGIDVRASYRAFATPARPPGDEVSKCVLIAVAPAKSTDALGLASAQTAALDRPVRTATNAVRADCAREAGDLFCVAEAVRDVPVSVTRQFTGPSHLRPAADYQDRGHGLRGKPTQRRERRRRRQLQAAPESGSPLSHPRKSRGRERRRHALRARDRREATGPAAVTPVDRTSVVRRRASS
jgi:hypothetical protein